MDRRSSDGYKTLGVGHILTGDITKFAVHSNGARGALFFSWSLSLPPRVLYYNRNTTQIISLYRVAVGHSGLDSTNRRFWPIFQHIFPKLLTRGDHFCNRKPYFFLSTWGGSCLCGAPDANARLTHSVKRSVSIESEQRTWRGVGQRRVDVAQRKQRSRTACTVARRPSTASSVVSPAVQAIVPSVVSLVVPLGRFRWSRCRSVSRHIRFVDCA